VAGAAVMSKIEKPQAIDRLPEILEASDALMVARGDLGVELPLERVPSLQKQMTRLARRAGKPVVVATQMLESMIQSPVPTRAEVSDVATAVYEGADAIMLSAESAAGKCLGRSGLDHEPHRRGSGARPHLSRGAQRAARRAGTDRWRRPLPMRATNRRNARSVGDHLLDQFRIDRAARRTRAAEAARRRNHAEPSPPGASCPRCGACIGVVAEDAQDLDDMVNRAGSIAFSRWFAKAGQRVNHRRRRAARRPPAPPTCCASPPWARTATRICKPRGRWALLPPHGEEAL